MARDDLERYRSEGIIAYIGNKRRLLPLIGEALEAASGGPLDGLRLADPFSGSGIVSRYARSRGMRVLANDWEPYARVLARAWLEPVPEDIPRLFGGEQGLDEAVDAMNALPPPSPEECYLARYYAPASDRIEDADYRTERLFYTRGNALRLDAARNSLERTAATSKIPLSGDDADLRFCLLLAPILYAAATQVNTSGVFKAYHKGFGGHGRDALGRITRPIRFQSPVVVDREPGRVLCGDANALADEGAFADADAVYLDPPYNQHQYGSNYHLLNTLVRWDRIPEPLELDSTGRLRRKAAIRPDWVRTRSAYCTRRGASDAFDGLLDALQAPALLVSYSTDGIIPFERLRRRCEAYGRLRILVRPYATYRGGRQSAARRDRNLEFIMIVERGRRTSRVDRDAVDRMLLRRRYDLLAKDFFHPDRLRVAGRFRGDDWTPDLPGNPPTIPTRHRIRFPALPEFDDLSDQAARCLVDHLEQARSRSRDEDLELIETAWRSHPGLCGDLLRELPRILRKLAHRKHREAFERHLAVIRSLGLEDENGYAAIADDLQDIEALAADRFAG